MGQCHVQGCVKSAPRVVVEIKQQTQATGLANIGMLRQKSGEDGGMGGRNSKENVRIENCFTTLSSRLKVPNAIFVVKTHYSKCFAFTTYLPLHSLHTSVFFCHASATSLNTVSGKVD